MYDPLAYEVLCFKDKTDRKWYRCCLEYRKKYAEIGHYLAIISAMQEPQMLKTDYFSLCILRKKRLLKVFYAFGSRMLQYENLWFVREILCDSSTAANQVNKKWAGTFCTRTFTGIIRKLLNTLKLPWEVLSALDLLPVASSLKQMNFEQLKILDFSEGFSLLQKFRVISSKWFLCELIGFYKIYSTFVSIFFKGKK